MITRYGMCDDFDMVAMEHVQNQYLGQDVAMNCSDSTAAEIDRKVIELVKTQHEKAKKLISEHMDDLDRLADFLYHRETITGEEFMYLLNHKEPPIAEAIHAMEPPVPEAAHV